jgi:hypothetical protein
MTKSTLGPILPILDNFFQVAAAAQCPVLADGPSHVGVSTMNKEDCELIDSVRSDIEAIEREMSGPVNQHALRRISVVLRRLINDGDLMRVWRLLGLEPAQPIIPTHEAGRGDELCVKIKFVRKIGDGLEVELESLVKHEVTNVFITGDVALDENDNVIWPAPESRHPELTIMGRIPTTVGFASTGMPGVPSAGPIAVRGATHHYPLNKFKDSCALRVKGARVTRQQVVAYIANKKGGAHYEKRRKDDDQIAVLLDELAEGAKIAPAQLKALNQQLGTLGTANEIQSMTVQVGNPNDEIYEVLAGIIKFIVEAPDIKRLMGAARPTGAG